jgi:hypothetical protein
VKIEFLERWRMAFRLKAILCGDSILDNGVYVGVNGRSVHSHLVEFATAWAIDFRAIDGAVCADVAASHLSYILDVR